MSYRGFTIAGNGVLVRLLERLSFPEKTAGGIIIPEEFREEFARNGQHEVRAIGEVLDVGKGELIRKGPRAGERNPLECKVGDRILFIPRAPNDPIWINGEELWSVHERGHVDAILEG